MGNKNTQIQQYGALVRNQRNLNIQDQLKTILARKIALNIDQKMQRTVREASAGQLAQLLNQKQVNSKQLVTIFAHRAATLGMQLNLITEDNFENAYLLAEKCDQIRQQTKKDNWTLKDEGSQDAFLPALFGVPFSVKDAFDMVGKRTTLGVTVRAHTIKQKDCNLVASLKSSGMIPFARTNVSQLTMIFQTNNYLWGRSLNIWNTDRSVGGSSGGEAGLIAARCSPMGIGNDIGGSLRIPAEYCGICSIKPSANRLSSAISQSTEFKDMFTGKDTFKSVNGPLARTVDDLALWMKIALNEKHQVERDPYLRLIPFDEKIYLQHQKERKLKIGYYLSQELLETTAASRRALEQVVQCLRRQGHELLEVQIPNFTKMVQEFYSEMSCEGKVRSFQEILQGQDFIPEYKKMAIIAKLPKWVKKGVKVLLGKLAPRLATIMEKTDELTMEEYLVHVTAIERYKRQMYAMWKSLQLDHIVTPGFGCQANLHGLTSDISPAAAYTLIWNVVGYVAGAVPVTVVREQEQRYESRHRDLLTSALRRNVERSVGLPVGVQVIGLPFEEEKVLGLMKFIEREIQFNSKYRPSALQ